MAEPLDAVLSCLLCSRPAGDLEWSTRCRVVFLDGNQINIGSAVCPSPTSPIGRAHITEHRALTSNTPIFIKVRSSTSCRTATNAFLIHEPCFYLLGSVSGDTPLSIAKLFKLGQALQANRERGYACDDWPDQTILLSPLEPVIPAGAEKQWKDWSPPVNAAAGTLRLPSEIILMILEHLPPETLINFFCASSTTLEFAPQFCKLHRWHLFPSINPQSTSRSIQQIIGTIKHTFSGDKYTTLDNRWKVISFVETLPRLLSYIHIDPGRRTRSVRDHSQECPHDYGLRRLTFTIPDHVTLIDVYTRQIRDDSYVCGLGWSSGTEESLVGSLSGVKLQIAFEQAALYFITDLLGIKLIKFGQTPWQPESTTGWQGLSILRENPELVIMADGLKFRSIAWLQTQDVSFEETLILRNQCISDIGIADEERYITENTEAETDLIERYGNITMECLRFDDDMHGITMHSNGEKYGIVGVRVHSSTDQFAGHDGARAKYFPLSGPAEVVTEIDVRASSLSIALVVRTNWGRQCLFGCTKFPSSPYPLQTLRPPEGHFISGIYFRFGNRWKIESFGIIYKPGLRGMPPPPDSYFPPLPIPELPNQYAINPMDKFESVAALRGLKRIEWYYDRKFLNTVRCIGLKLFYRHGGLEVIGKAEGEVEREVTFGDDESVRRVWISLFEEKVLRDIDFETTKSPDVSYKGTPHEVTATTCVMWWYTPQRDIIRIYEPGSAEPIV